MKGVVTREKSLKTRVPVGSPVKSESQQASTVKSTLHKYSGTLTGILDVNTRIKTTVN